MTEQKFVKQEDQKGELYILKDNPKEIIVILECENLEKIKQFV